MNVQPPSLHVYPTWSPVHRGLYRFVSAYMLLYASLTLSVVLSFVHVELTQHFVFFDEEAFRDILPWVALHILRMREPLTSPLSGDGSFHWVEQFVLLATALIASVVWSALDLRRPNYRLLDRWLRLFVRLGLASILFAYGFDKVFPNQFRPITRYDLVQQFGDLDHFSLMWKFMAASKGYTIFSGVLEVMAGALLMVPPLASAGALLSIVVMSNVVALNLAYNIPVKLLSMNILLMAVYLSAPELPRLWTLLVQNRAVTPYPQIALSTNRRVDRGVQVVQLALGVIFFATFWYAESRRYQRMQMTAAVNVPLQGIWLVDDFAITGGTQSSLFTPKLLEGMKIQSNEERWSKLVFDTPGRLVIQTEAGNLDFVRLKLNTENNEALLTDSGDAAWKADLRLQQPRPDLLNVQGVVNGLQIRAELHKVDESRFKVTKEGLHFVQPSR